MDLRRRHTAIVDVPAAAGQGLPDNGTERPPEASISRPDGPVSTRASRTWVALAIGMVLLVIVLVFIVQNLKDVQVNFLAVHWRLPLAIDLLLSTLLGGLIVFTAGSIRILQLRRRIRRPLRRPRPDAGVRAES